MKKLSLIACLACIPFFLFAQTEVAITNAQRIESTIKIDGNLSEIEWQNMSIVDHFLQREPNPGKPCTQKTEIKVLYDNTSIYIAAILHENFPDSILAQLTERDDLGNTDYFGITLDPYQGGVDGVGFITTPVGVQYDTKYLTNGEDSSWDAVWLSKSKITKDGWIVEMKIPFSAIRFPNKEVQEWNVNFVRFIRRNREQVWWNFFDPQGNGLLNQMGKMTGLKNIKSPVRLSATPFVVGYAQNLYDKNNSPKSNWGSSINGGMDIKYGINDAFTLDMTLIPDFGEANSDNQVLNLSPFEVRFDENRQFFTEGVELFNKGNLFYSRRVGGRVFSPFDESSIDENEEIIENPIQSQLLNATKVSGRTRRGTGVGVFNAVAGQSEAIIYNRETDISRSVLTNPLTNYNVFVMDQNLKNNSSISLTNTNVLRSGNAYDANVTAGTFDLNNKKNTYGVSGKLAVSQKYSEGNQELGHNYNASFNKLSGRWRFATGYNVESDTYDINDLGFIFNNNERTNWANVRFNQYEPFGKFNRGGGGVYMRYSRLYAPDLFTSYGGELWVWLATRSFFAFGGNVTFEPFNSKDYFEPRVEEIGTAFYSLPVNYNFESWLSTNYNKQFAIDFNWNYRWFDEDGRFRLNFEVSPRYRVNDRFNFRFTVENLNFMNDVGYVTDFGEENIIFGIRDQTIWNNSLSANYSFTTNMNLNFRLRHYWTNVKYDAFKQLQKDGSLGITDYGAYNDRSFSAFNIDMVYRWRFAPGSDLFFIWKNSIFDFEDTPEFVQTNYFESVEDFLDSPVNNSFSLKMIYYLDYLEVANKLKKG